MDKDDKVIARIPKTTKENYVEVGAKLNMTMGDVVREALEFFYPVLVRRVEEKEKALAS